MAKDWTQEEAYEIYNRLVRPKTYTLYSDAISPEENDTPANLYKLMSMMIAQTTDDLYTIWLDCDPENAQYTKPQFIKSYFAQLLDLCVKEEQAGPKIIN